MSDLDYVKVIGRLGIVVVDAALDDPDVNPDTIWCDEGQVHFTPLITSVKVVNATPVPATLGQSTIVADIDADGYLSLRGTRAINLVDLTSTKVNPSIAEGKATHKVEFLGLAADGQPVNIPSPVNVRFAADTVDPGTGAVDITLVTPVPVAGGTAQIVGPPGTSAYESWLSQGNTGSLSEFLEATTAKIWFGTGAPAGATGSVGHWSIDTVTWNVYEKTAATTWTLRGNIKGGTGAQGIPGTPGTGSVNLPTLVTNLVANPSVETGSSGWLAEAGATIATSTTDFKFGSQSLLLTHTSSTTAGPSAYIDAPVVAGRTYTFSVYVKRQAGTIGAAVNTLGSWAAVLDSSKAYTSEHQDWVRLSLVILAKGTVARLYVHNAPAFATVSNQIGSAIYIDGAMLTEGPTLHNYFDGSTPGCYWTGTAHASTSVKGLFNAVDGAATVRTDRAAHPVSNFVTNPRPTSLTGWSSLNNNGALAFVADGAREVGQFTASAAVGAWQAGAAITVSNQTVGRRYTVSGYIKAVGASGVQYIIRHQATNTNVAVSTTDYTYVSMTYTAATSTEALRITNNNTTVVGEGFRFHSIAVHEADQGVTDYFDGDSKWSYWTGTPHASTSVYAPPQAEDLVLKRNVPVLYTNLVTNPSFETSLAPMQGAGTVVATVTRDSTKSFVGSSSIKMVSGSSANNAGVFHNTPRPSVSPNKTYTSSIYVNPDTAGEYKFETRFWTGGGSPSLISTHTDTKTLGVGSWKRFALTLVAPSTAGSVDFVVRMPDNSVAYVDALMLTETPHPVDYFDGSSPGCEWTGTPHASTSVKRFKSKQVDLNNVPSYAENLLPQPKASDAQTLWQSAGTNTTFTKSGKDFVLTAIASGNVIIQTGGGAPSINHARVEPGKQYNIRGKFKAATTSRTVQLDYGTYNEFGSGSYHVSPVFLTDNSSGYTEISYNITVPEGRTYLRLVPIVLSAAAGETHYLTEFSVVEVSGISNSYFDGDTEGCYWTGTPGASTSVKKFPKRDDVVLTSRMPELARNWFTASPAFTVDYSGTYGSTAPTKSVIAGRSPGVNAIRVVHNSVGGDHGIQISPSGLDAGNYNLTLLYRNNSANPVNVRIRTINGDSGSPQSTGATAITLPGNSGWVRHTHWFNMSAAGFAKIRVLEFYDNGNPGASVDVTEPVLTLGPNPNVEFFSGDTPGCRWLGAPEISPSIRVLHSSADYAFLTWLDAGRAQAVGSPEGKFTATVGTRYVDTAATNGAIEWIKASGTGNVGWVVTHGDTGWRNITANTNAALFSINLQWLIRRYNSNVILRAVDSTFVAGVTSSDIIYTLTAGFYVDMNYQPLPIQAINLTPSGQTRYLRARIDTNGVYPFSSDLGGVRFAMRHEWITSSPWPTTLPGTPA